MKYVLIVDDEVNLLESLKDGFESYRDRFRILVAPSGKAAVKILDSKPVDLVITDLKMPGMSGFKLLSYISLFHYTVPVMVMTAYSTPALINELKVKRSIRIFEKPIDFNEMLSAILEVVETEEGGGLSGISLTSFLQMMAAEEKTGLIEVRCPDRTGYVYCRGGEVHDAVFAGKNGEAALYAMLARENVRLKLRPAPIKTIRRRIERDLMFLLMEATRTQDESASDREIDAVSIEAQLKEKLDFLLGEDDALPINQELLFPSEKENGGGLTLLRLRDMVGVKAVEVRGESGVSLWPKDSNPKDSETVFTDFWEFIRSAPDADLRFLHMETAACQLLARPLYAETEKSWLLVAVDTDRDVQPVRRLMVLITPDHLMSEDPSSE